MIIGLTQGTLNEHSGILFQFYGFRDVYEFMYVVFLFAHPALDLAATTLCHQLPGLNPQLLLDLVPDLTFKIHEPEYGHGLWPICRS